MTRGLKITLLTLSFITVGAAIIYWAHSNISETIGIKNPSNLHTGILVFGFIANFLHIRCMGNLIFEERLINYVIEDGFVRNFTYDKARNLAKFEIFCPLSSKHPEYWQPLDQLYRFIGGSVYLNRDGRTIELVLSECYNVEIEVTEPPAYSGEPDRIVDWSKTKHGSTDRFSIETDGAHYAFDFADLNVKEIT